MPPAVDEVLTSQQARELVGWSRYKWEMQMWLFHKKGQCRFKMPTPLGGANYHRRDACFRASEVVELLIEVTLDDERRLAAGSYVAGVPPRS